MKEVIKIVLSNWINLLTIFIVVYAVGFLSVIIDYKFTFIEALFATIYSIVGYGMLFWTGFIVCILILDILLFSLDRKPRNITIKLFVEWLIISAPFIYWLIKYEEWIFIAAILAFLLGQYLRRSYIFRIST
jgi:hypothetical protein